MRSVIVKALGVFLLCASGNVDFNHKSLRPHDTKCSNIYSSTFSGMGLVGDAYQGYPVAILLPVAWIFDFSRMATFHKTAFLGGHKNTSPIIFRHGSSEGNHLLNVRTYSLLRHNLNCNTSNPKKTADCSYPSCNSRPNIFCSSIEPTTRAKTSEIHLASIINLAYDPRPLTIAVDFIGLNGGIKSPNNKVKSYEPDSRSKQRDKQRAEIPFGHIELRLQIIIGFFCIFVGGWGLNETRKPVKRAAFDHDGQTGGWAFLLATALVCGCLMVFSGVISLV